MKPLILEIAKRLIKKTMPINSDDFMADIKIGFIDGNILTVTLFDKSMDNNTFWFQNSNDDRYLKYQYKEVLKLINKRRIR